MTNIYVITNLITGTQYVGKTIKTLEQRFYSHCQDSSKVCIAAAIRKYGKENFTISLLQEVRDSEWKYWEEYYIRVLKTHWTDGGYNLSRGGDWNPMDDPEVRRRHAEACASESHRAKQRIASLGYKHTLEAKKKMSEIQKIVQNLPEVKHKVRMNQPTRQPVIMLDKDENVIETFDTLVQACEYHNKNVGYTSAIKQVADKYNKNGKRAKFLGYYWSLVEKV